MQTLACLTPVGAPVRCSALVELQLGGAGEGPEAAGAALQALTYYNRPARVAYLRELVQALLDGKNEAYHLLRHFLHSEFAHWLLKDLPVCCTITLDQGTCMDMKFMACETASSTWVQLCRIAECKQCLPTQELFEVAIREQFDKAIPACRHWNCSTLPCSAWT